MTTEKRYVITASVAGKEIVRRAVWATELPTQADVFTDEEFASLVNATKTEKVTLKIVETPF